jgi:carboxylate-amine ligase
VRTVGVEEELLVVDGTGRPVPVGPDALEIASRRGEGESPAEHDRAERDDTPDGGDEGPSPHLMPELKAQQLELGTPVCHTLAEVGAELRHWRGRADAAAAAVGGRVAALATAPVPVEPIATEGERYGRMLDAFGLTAREMLTCGCHVHVSVDDDEEGVAVLNRIRVWLPVLTALTANSPFWHGVDTGYASYRTQVWHRWPSAGPTDVFADAADYHRLIDEVLATDTVLDTGMVYFDARLSDRWPTVEVAARESRDGTPPPSVRAEVLRVATWRAARSGVLGDLVHPVTRRPAPAADVLGALLDHVRAALTDAGDEQRVTEGLRDLLHRGTGADLQRRVHRDSDGDLGAVVRAAVALTAGEPAEVSQAGDRRSG